MEHPITPPPELVNHWRKRAPVARDGGATREQWIATQAARWGDDQRLEACEKWMHVQHLPGFACQLHAAMRPKPLSLAEQAEREMVAVRMHANHCGFQCDTPIIDRALKRLAELEALNDD